jgi:hypothetical protein
MRHELTDHEWVAIRPILPNKPRGVPRVNDRRVLNGISGCCGRRRIAMQTAESEQLGTTSKNGDEVDFATPRSSEDLVDQFGIKIALWVLSAALVLAAWPGES